MSFISSATSMRHPIAPDTPKLRGMRERLAAELAEKGIKDANVLTAIRTVPRHAFVESAFAEKAYVDIPLPIGCEQTISQPYTVAFMTQALRLGPGAKVLEIGTGSGYQAAILCALQMDVYSIERQRPLTVQAKHVLDALGYHPRLKVGDGTLGWPAAAPFDGIIVTAGGPTIPEAMRNQLAVGGRLVIPVGDRDVQQLHIVTRLDEGTGPASFDTEIVDNFRFVPLIGRHGWAG